MLTELLNDHRIVSSVDLFPILKNWSKTDLEKLVADLDEYKKTNPAEFLLNERRLLDMSRIAMFYASGFKPREYYALFCEIWAGRRSL